MRATDNASTQPRSTALVRREGVAFRSRGRVTAMTAATLVTVLVGLLFAVGLGNGTYCSEGPVEVPCPTDPVGPQGAAVSDTFYFVHRPMGENGSITVRLTSMTGIITYPPPDHDEIVPGIVPWAKAGIIVKNDLAQGSSYAALMLTGAHGVRMQHDYVHDVAGDPGGVSAEAPRWLRLTRSGDTITGHESSDGTRWTDVGTAHLPGLPDTVQVGLFAASPGDLTLTPVALGGSIPAARFTQLSATFDSVVLAGAPAGEWRGDAVGEMGHTDWERFHRAPGLVEANGTFTVTGTGDIGPVGTEAGVAAERTLVGLPIAVVIVIVVAVRFATPADRPEATGDTALDGRALAAKAVVVSMAAFLVGLVSAAVVIPVGTTILRAYGTSFVPLTVGTGLRVVVGVGALLAVVAVAALGLGALLRRTWVASIVAISAVVLPYLLAAPPLLPDAVADWLLRLTPAAGFAVTQTIREFPQVIAHYAPSAGYFPLAWWAGFAVLGGYATVVLGMAAVRLRRPISATRPQRRWR